MRVGLGYDSHRFIEGRPLVLGGVRVLFDRGLAGWSDADVLAHALIDALCGAAGLGDIGMLFPPGDEAFRGASSIELLQTTVQMVTERGMRVSNADTVIVAERPLLGPYVGAMRQLLSEVLLTDVANVSVKSKTAEGMGAVGRGEGIVAYAVVLLVP